jgi:HEAT repeat protein
MDPRLPPPADLDAPVRALVASLAHRVGEAEAVDICADLLAGAEPAGYASVLPYLAGSPAYGLLEGTWREYWARTWGGRGLLHVWRDSAADVVVAGLDDEHWRPAEMCLKVAAARELAIASDGAVALARHELPRVRACALRMLGRAGDTEHVEVVRDGLEDPHADVRRAAALALERMVARLDLPGSVLP